MQYTASDEKRYNFPYCLKNKHKQSLKSYICLEQQCQSKKHVCFCCFQEGNEHNQHQIIPSELLLNIAHKKILFPKIPQQIEKIDQLIQKSRTAQNAEHLTSALLQLQKLLQDVVNFHQIKEYSIFYTNSIIELTYQLIAQNRNVCKIKQPHSLKLTEFELSVETIPSIIYIIKFEIEQLKKKQNDFPKLLGFEEISKQNKTQKNDEVSYLRTFRKNYSQTKRVQLQPSNQDGTQSTQDSTPKYMRTRSYDLSNDISQKQIIQKPKELRQCKEKKEQTHSKQLDTQIQIENSNDNNKYNLKNIKYSPLQKVIQDYNKTDEVQIDVNQMQIAQRAHEGEGSGSNINQIVTMGEDGYLKFWNPSNLKCLHVIKLKEQSGLDETIIRDIQYLKRIKCIAAISSGHIAIINIINYKVIKRIYVEAINLDSCDQLGLLFFVNNINKCITIYNFFSFQQVGELPKQEEDITSLAYAKKGDKYFYFTGNRVGHLHKFDLDERKYLINKKVNSSTIFYISTCRYNNGDESIVTFCCNSSSQIKIINIDNLDVIVNLSYQIIDSAICWNNEIYLLQGNNHIIQIIADQEMKQKKMSKVPSSFQRGTGVFNQALRWVRSERVAVLCQYSTNSLYSNLVKFPIIKQNNNTLND